MLLRRLAQTRRLYSSQASGTPRDLLFVFLEGGAATGKSSLCAELEQRGYKVQYEGFVSLCKQNPRYSPSGSVLSIKWVSAMFSSLEQFTDRQHSGAQQYKDGLVFFDRSFLTPWIYTRGAINNLYVLDAMKEIREAFRCQLVLCEAGADAVHARLQARYDAGTPAEKAIRDNLGEMNVEYRQHIAGRYETLKRDGWFDFCIASDLPRVADTADDLLRRLAR